MARDLVPMYVTEWSTPDEGYVRRVSEREYFNMTNTHIFELACYGVNFTPSYVRRKFSSIVNLPLTESHKDWHHAKYPEGGVSPLTLMTLGGYGYY